MDIVSLFPWKSDCLVRNVTTILQDVDVHSNVTLLESVRDMPS